MAALVLIRFISHFDFELFYMWRGFFFLPVADLINRQLTMAECAACQPPLWLGRSPPFCGLGPLCPRFSSLSSTSVCQPAWGGRGARGRRKEGKPEEERRGVKKEGRKRRLFDGVDVVFHLLCS